MKKIMNKYIFISFMMVTLLTFCASAIFAKDMSENTITFYKNSDVINQDIVFDPVENENVAKNKIAPGSKAVSDIVIDLSNLDFNTELDIKLDENLKESFSLTYMIDDNVYTENDVINFDAQDGNVNIKLILEWIPTSIDNYIVSNYSIINIPIYISVKESI